MEAIDLEAQGLTDEGLRSWLDATSPHDLDEVEFIGLRANRLTGEGLRRLFAASAFGNLECIEMGENALGEGLSQLGAVHARPSEFHAQFNALGDDEIVALVASGLLNEVHHLSLWGNPFGDAGLQSLARAPSRPSGLFLHWTGGTDAGLAALLQSPFVSRVQHLDLRGTAAGPLTASAIAGSDPLRANLSVLKARQSNMLADHTAVIARSLAASAWVQSVAPMQADHDYHCYKCMGRMDESAPRCPRCLVDVTTDPGYALTAHGYAAEAEDECEHCARPKKRLASCAACHRDEMLAALPHHLLPSL